MRGYGYYPDYFAIVEAQLSSLVELTDGETLLDVGCGKGALAAYAREDLGLRVVGTDASRHAIRFAAQTTGGRDSVRANCAQLPFADDSFDLVWCNGVLQYLEAGAARAALAGMARVCRTAVFVSNIAWAQQHTEWGKRDHLTRLYLRPRQWALLAAEAIAEAAGGAGWHAVALPFEGESAILLVRAGAMPPSFSLRFVELSLERMRRLGALTRTPPGLDAFYRAQWKPGGQR